MLTQKHGDEGLRVATLWLQALADEQYKWQGDIGQLCLILALGSLCEVPVTLLTTFLADIAHTDDTLGAASAPDHCPALRKKLL